MSNALLSDVEARAERRRTRTRLDMVQELAQLSWDRAQAAGDAAEARSWLERARRLAPKDGAVAGALAANLLTAGELEEASVLFESAARAHGSAESWAGLATCAHLLGQPARARAALLAALHRRSPDQTLVSLADAVAPGDWCGLDTEGMLYAAPGAACSVLIDGVPRSLRWSGRKARLPKEWRRATSITVQSPAGPLLGSPLPVPVFAGVDGFASAERGAVIGWARVPADRTRIPMLTVSGPNGQATIRAEAPLDLAPADTPAHARRFSLSPAEVAALGTPLSLRGPDGRHLLGSPLDPTLEARDAAGGTGLFSPVWADTLGQAPPSARRHPVDVVVPVYRGLSETMACLHSVLDTLPRGSRLVVVDDASPEPELVAAIQVLARRRRLTLLRLPENLGFPGAANAGIEAASGRDVVLLNSDTLVPPAWLDRLRRAAYSAPDIGTVTPLTNDGTIVSYPDPDGGNPVPDLSGAAALDSFAQAANAGTVVDIPVGVGFCLYIRRDCLDRVGLLRADLFAQGYGEENDLCLRARHHGFRNVAAPGVFVAHAGATSFGPARTHLIRRNAAILARLHPGYDELVARHIAADPLLEARRRMDALRWAAGRSRSRAGAVVMITHAGGGGVDRVIDDRAQLCRAEGARPILLQPWRSTAGIGVRLREAGSDSTPNLLFRLPEEMPALLGLLRGDRPVRMELHHLLGHQPGIADLAARLRVPLHSVIHDYARFCPRIALVSTNRRYCGEPDIAGCESCIADLGSLLEEDPPVPELVRRSAAELAAAARVIAPSRDAAARIRRHFPGTEPAVEPWGHDGGFPPLRPAPERGSRRVAVIGAIGTEKGYDVLLGCVRDAKARALPLHFTVVGFTADDERLLAAGPVHVTGEYAEAEAPALIRAQSPQLCFIPSVWPETWCFALTRAWEAGLAAAVFDLGAQAERVRSTGRGWLLPLGLPAERINDILLRLAPDQPAGQSPPTFS